MNCTYEAIQANPDGTTRYRCGICGHSRTSAYPPELLHRQCPSAEPQTRKVAKTSAGLTKEWARCQKCGDYDSGDCELLDHVRASRCNQYKAWAEAYMKYGCPKDKEKT